MSHLIDTNVVIHLRDGDARVTRNMAGLDAVPALSMMTRIELENGVYRDPDLADIRRANLDIILQHVNSIEFGDAELRAYQSILAAAGYSKRKTIDRMIAATAIAHDLTLITKNGADFRDIQGLKLLEW